MCHWWPWKGLSKQRKWINGRTQDLDKEIHAEAPTGLRDTCGSVNRTQSVSFEGISFAHAWSYVPIRSRVCAVEGIPKVRWGSETNRTVALVWRRWNRSEEDRESKVIIPIEAVGVLICTCAHACVWVSVCLCRAQRGLSSVCVLLTEI